MRNKRNVPNVVSGGSAIPIKGKPNYYYMRGRKHENGGIKLGTNPRTGIEVEDGEVLHIGEDSAKVFSTIPMINGESPADKVLAGSNPKEVFAKQEQYKRRNNLRNDGNKRVMGGLEDLSNNINLTDEQLGYLQAGASMLPIVGSAMDVYEAVKNPSLANIGSAALSVGMDLTGLGVAKGLYKGIKTARAVAKANAAARRVTAAKKVAGKVSIVAKQNPIIANAKKAAKQSFNNEVKQSTNYLRQMGNNARRGNVGGVLKAYGRETLNQAPWQALGGIGIAGDAYMQARDKNYPQHRVGGVVGYPKYKGGGSLNRAARFVTEMASRGYKWVGNQWDGVAKRFAKNADDVKPAAEQPKTKAKRNPDTPTPRRDYRDMKSRLDAEIEGREMPTRNELRAAERQEAKRRIIAHKRAKFIKNAKENAKAIGKGAGIALGGAGVVGGIGAGIYGLASSYNTPKTTTVPGTNIPTRKQPKTNVTQLKDTIAGNTIKVVNGEYWGSEAPVNYTPQQTNTKTNSNHPATKQTNSIATSTPKRRNGGTKRRAVTSPSKATTLESNTIGAQTPTITNGQTEPSKKLPKHIQIVVDETNRILKQTNGAGHPSTGGGRSASTAGTASSADIKLSKPIVARNVETQLTRDRNSRNPLNRIVGGIGRRVRNAAGNVRADDAISVGGNILGSILSHGVNSRMLDQLAYGDAPVMTTPAKLRTKIDINAPLDRMREAAYQYGRHVANNTASSRVATGRINNNNAKTIDGMNQLHSQKNAAEVELGNKDALNRQYVRASNVATYNEWAKGRDDFNNRRTEMRSENDVALIDGINSALQGGIDTARRRNSERNTLVAMAAANPNVNPRYLRDLGISGYTQADIDAWEAANRKKRGYN